MKQIISVMCALAVTIAAVAVPTRAALPSNAEDGAHQQAPQEWWHLTGHVTSTDGHHFGYQLTFFRFAASPAARRDGRPHSGWHSREFYPAVLAVTDDDARRFSSAERLGRPTLGIAGANAQHLSVHVDDWRLEDGSTARSPSQKITARAGAAGVGIDLLLAPVKGRVDNGGGGVFRKGDCACNWRYTSYSRLATQGSMRFGDSTYRVAGVSRLDHEYGPSATARNVVGWDWFGFVLDDGREVMLYVLRDADGKADKHSIGTMVNRDGTVTRLTAADFSTNAWNSQFSTTWFSPHSSTVYPALWKIAIPSQHMLFSASPLVQDQEVQPTAGGVPYWEGSVVLQDEDSGGARIGDGFVSLVGYGRPTSQ